MATGITWHFLPPLVGTLLFELPLLSRKISARLINYSSNRTPQTVGQIAKLARLHHTLCEFRCQEKEPNFRMSTSVLMTDCIVPSSSVTAGVKCVMISQKRSLYFFSGTVRGHWESGYWNCQKIWEPALHIRMSVQNIGSIDESRLKQDTANCWRKGPKTRWPLLTFAWLGTTKF